MLQFAFCVTVKQTLNLEPEHPVTGELLKNFVNFMQAVVSLPIYSLVPLMPKKYKKFFKIVRTGLDNSNRYFQLLWYMHLYIIE